LALTMHTVTAEETAAISAQVAVPKRWCWSLHNPIHGDGPTTL